MEKKPKLSKLQQKVVDAINDGAILITDSSMKGAWIAFDNQSDNFHISNRCFWNLVDKGVIYQQLESPHDYILTLQYTPPTP